MTSMIPFESNANVPAFIREAAKGNLADVSIGAGYPHISIKGKVFTFKDGEESRLITKPGTDEPTSSLEVVILDVGPSADLKYNSRVFYLKKYEEGSNAKPDCYSEDGIKPGPDSQEPQSKTCELCPHNVKGSGDTGKGKACRSSKRLAVATPDALDKPMLLRVPGDSLKAFSDYMKWMVQKGIQDTAHVITKVGFDYSVAHPNLTFKGLGWVTSDPTEFKDTDTVQYITGKKQLPVTQQVAEEPFEQPAPDFTKKAAKEEATAPAKVEKAEKPAKTKVEDDLPSEPKVKTEIAVESKAAEEPAVKVADSSFDAALDDLDFDA